MFALSDYDYSLPDQLIAQDAAHPQHSARMMVIDRETGKITAETIFWDLDTQLGKDRVLFFNNSRVVRSRISLHQARYITTNNDVHILKEGEIFFLAYESPWRFEALVRPGNKLKVGVRLNIGRFELHIDQMTDTGRIISVIWGSIEDLLKEHGQLPLPPYIKYSAQKETDYQTAFAKEGGSVAAPTASLHFTEELLDKIKNQKEYLTLHVWLGTFKGIQTDDIRDYNIHHEAIHIPIHTFASIARIKMEWKKIVAVGTTACRTLESLPSLWLQISIDIKKSIDANTRKYWDELTFSLKDMNWIHNLLIHTASWGIRFKTGIYITPGYSFLIVDDLITNFHIPRSSLLVLVSAFLWWSATKAIYDHAIASRYRFYSFGDGMYIRGR